MLPKELLELQSKFGDCEIVDIRENVPANLEFKNFEPMLGACVILRDKNDELVLIRRSYSIPGVEIEHWTFVCGKLKGNESLEETGVREILEEIGCSVSITGLHHIGHHYIEEDGSNITLYYVAVMFADLISGVPRVNSNEILEVGSFRQLPDNFIPEYRKYYSDLF